MAPKKRRRKRKSLVTLKIERQNKLNKRKYTRRYILLRNRIMARDNYTCQLKECKNPTGVKCQVHHIVKYSANKALRSNKFNLVTICNKCAMEHVNGREKKYEAYFKTVARRNERNYAKNKKSKEEILNKLKEQQQLPDGFETYKYASDEEINKKKKEEYFIKRLHRLIKFRTQNKNSNSYKAYGGRGITMYAEWINNYDAFEKYIHENLGDRPEGFSIDRIENDRGYEPGNIRWANAEVQGQNRRTTVLDEDTVCVILILYYKYKFKISKILDIFNLPSRSPINGVIKGKTWTNITKKYVSIIDNQEVVDKILKKK